MKLREFAAITGGAITGNPDIEITGVASIEKAAKGDITFISSPRYLKFAKTTEAACIMVKEEIEDCGTAQLRVSNPQYCFAKALEIFYPAEPETPGTSRYASVHETVAVGEGSTVHPFVFVDEGASIGKGCVLHPGVYIGKDSSVGDDCVLHPNVVIRENIRIGNRVIIHAGAVIGADGFGYVFEAGTHYKIPQVGGVIIEDDVEIGACSCVDRATIDETIIGRGTKIDNLAQIAHNVIIGEKTLIVAQTGIGGSTEIGAYSVIGGQVAIADHSVIEPGTMIVSQSGLTGHISKGVYAGSPAIPHKIWLRAQALYGKLPEMQKKLRELEEKLDKLQKGEQRDERQ